MRACPTANHTLITLKKKKKKKREEEGRNQQSAAHKHFIMIHCAVDVEAGWITSFLDRRGEVGHWRWDTYGNFEVACVLCCLPTHAVH